MSSTISATLEILKYTSFHSKDVINTFFFSNSQNWHLSLWIVWKFVPSIHKVHILLRAHLIVLAALCCGVFCVCARVLVGGGCGEHLFLTWRFVFFFNFSHRKHICNLFIYFFCKSRMSPSACILGLSLYTLVIHNCFSKYKRYLVVLSTTISFLIFNCNANWNTFFLTWRQLSTRFRRQ